ncbi:helix-turn-helix transcriptional regulator [Pseudovibrio exalbescens]|uniref:helix-turn-helix domain-containing protein n=1 Tax=Pseudovibrio exalbescens TaxID=197461 RepID=UPI00236602A8|nr:helix-turn-helix transcriptional regulator [Pseudovibrio exalbescens]MDD7911228.1 helix-turn-helix transcriptional regulator [Pseudovibrio exalbescens]
MRAINHLPCILTVQTLKTLGQGIREIREEAGLSLDAFAKQLMVPPALVKRLEAGDANVPVGTLASALQALGVEISLSAKADAGAA